MNIRVPITFILFPLLCLLTNKLLSQSNRKLHDVAAQNKGITFESNLTWQEVLQKARTEHKYIFLDCYATWCAPCKWMDENVYGRQSAGDLFNTSFISIKVQIDKTKRDDAHVQSWYGDASALQSVYQIESLPTYLIFDPEGKLVLQRSGSLEPAAFVQLGKDAMNPDLLSYAAQNFQPGKLTTEEEKGLINVFTNSNKELAADIAADYLSRIPQEKLNESASVSLMVQFQDNPDVLNIALGILHTTPLRKNADIVSALVRQPAVKKIVEEYVTSLDQASFGDSANFQFTSLFLEDSVVRKATIDYIKRLDRPEMVKETNLDFMDLLKKEPEVKQVALNYINHLSENALYTKNNIRLIGTFTDSSADKGFAMFFLHAERVNAIMRDDSYSQGVVNPIISKEVISPIVKKAKAEGTEPDWDQISHQIREKYGKKYVEDNIVYAEMKWFQYKKDGASSAKYVTQWVEQVYKRKGIAGSHLSPIFWNNNAYNYIFMYDKDKGDLKKALTWMRNLNHMQKNPNPNLLDTEASLMYKLGMTKQAIETETYAAKLDPNAKEIADALQKMKNGEPTWSLSSKMPL